MKNTTFNVNFYCRPSKASAKGLAPIEMSVIINGERTYITLPRKEKPEDFNAAVVSRRNNDIKDYLAAARNRLNGITTEMMEQGLMLTAKTLKEFFMHGGVRHYTVENLFDEYVNIMSKREGVEMSRKTFRKYELAREKFFKVIDKDKPATAITSTVIAEFIARLRKEYNVCTTNGYVQKVKTVVKYGMSKGLIKINPFIGTHIRKGDIATLVFTRGVANFLRLRTISALRYRQSV